MTNLTLELKNQLLNNRYYLEYLIANGNYSHSQVFFARDIVTHRPCIIKRLCLDFCPSKRKHSAKLLFQHEAKILTRLNGQHSQISRLYDYFNDNGSSYLVQEWISGDTLAQKLWRKKGLSESQTRKILLSLLSVLDCIHSLGIIHRDIKPQNIILREEDRLPVLIDFSVAYQMSDLTPPMPMIVGTPEYMSREQSMGQIAYQNDLYSLGVTTICLLSGLPHNTRQNWRELSISDDLKLVIHRTISDKANLRFNSAQEMRAALLPTSPTKLHPENKEKSRFKSWLIYSILVIPIIGVWFIWRYPKTQLVTKPPTKYTQLIPEETLVVEDESLITKNADQKIATNIFQNVIFPVGSSSTQIIEALGEPVWRKPGFWSNSTAWSYENIVAKGIDLGYIFDTKSDKLLQVEIAVPPQTNYRKLQDALTFLCGGKTNPDLEQGLQTVYQRQQSTYNFTVEDLEGTIQRNHKDRIYMAVWQEDFH
ncbi:MAG: serine/threonine-protein kinase [Cyanobacteria bacterium P01_G01_bin.39]